MLRENGVRNGYGKVGANAHPFGEGASVAGREHQFLLRAQIVLTASALDTRAAAGAVHAQTHALTHAQVANELAQLHHHTDAFVTSDQREFVHG